jgi:hypothetical protein
VTSLAELLHGKQSLLLAPLDCRLLVEDCTKELLSVPLGSRIDLIDVGCIYRLVHQVRSNDFLLVSLRLNVSLDSAETNRSLD